jgi:hypothetical protein
MSANGRFSGNGSSAKEIPECQSSSFFIKNGALIGGGRILGYRAIQGSGNGAAFLSRSGNRIDWTPRGFD